MGKIRCKCDHIIVNQTDNIKYKGYILPDVYVDEVSLNLTDNIDSLLNAIKVGKKLEWIRKNFSPSYPTNLKESSMIHDALNITERIQDIFECENCGRIAIEIGQTNRFKFFSPDSDDDKGIFSQT